MKKFILILLVASVATSCALMSGATTNITNVSLEKNNFKVLDRLSGDAQATYFLGIGGNAHYGLVGEAKSNMISKSNASNSGKALAFANETVDVQQKFVLGIIRIVTVTVSADLIEFTN